MMLRCRHCGEVIGVYEPVIEVRGSRAVESSRALDPQLGTRDAEHFHRSCFEQSGPAADRTIGTP